MAAKKEYFIRQDRYISVLAIFKNYKKQRKENALKRYENHRNVKTLK